MEPENGWKSDPSNVVICQKNNPLLHFYDLFCLTWNILLTSSFSLPFFLYQLLSLLAWLSLSSSLIHLFTIFLVFSSFPFSYFLPISVSLFFSHFTGYPSKSFTDLSLSLLLSPSRFHTLTIFFISLQLPLYVFFVKICLSFF